jgi:hypothetical protein
MQISMPRARARNTRTACLAALASFVAFLVVPSAIRPVVVVVLVASALAVVLLAVVWIRTPLGSRTVGSMAVASAVGLLGAVAYLSSVADEPAAIPVVGTLVLLMSLVGLIVSALTLHDR